MSMTTELAAVLRLAAESEIAYRAEGETSDLWQDEASPENVLALVEALEAAEKRIAELEARTVKLPEPFKMAKSSSGLTYYYADEINEALTTAGIEWEEQ